MKKLIVAICALCVIPSAFAAPEFIPYQGDKPIQLGSGGAKEVYKDIDVWVSGTPQQEFEVLGYLTDRRHKTGLVGVFRMGGLKKALAKATKEAGGNALVKLSEYSETIGYTGSSNTQSNANVSGSSNYAYVNGSSNTWSTSSAVQKNNASFAVIRYVPISELSNLPANEVSLSQERCLAFPTAVNQQGAIVPASLSVDDSLGMIWLQNDGGFFWETGNSLISGEWSKSSEGFSTSRIFRIEGKSYRQASGSNLLNDETAPANPIAWLECIEQDAGV